MVTESQILSSQLEKLNAKIEQAARIEGKLRARKQAALAEKSYGALQKILAREKNVIDICMQGLTIASSLISATIDETKSLKPTKYLEDLVDVIKSGLKSATAGIQIWKEEFSLWNKFLAVKDAEKQDILAQIKAKQYQRDALTANLRQTEQLMGKIEDIQAGNIELLKGVVATMAASTGVPLSAFGQVAHEPMQQIIGTLMALGGFLYILYKTFGGAVSGIERKAL